MNGNTRGLGRQPQREAHVSLRPGGFDINLLAVLSMNCVKRKTRKKMVLATCHQKSHLTHFLKNRKIAQKFFEKLYKNCTKCAGNLINNCESNDGGGRYVLVVFSSSRRILSVFMWFGSPHRRFYVFSCGVHIY